jgi:hypothetical protein
MQMCATSPELAASWTEYLQAVASGKVAAALAAAAPSSGRPTSNRAQIPGYEGAVEASSADGRSWSRLHALLEPESRLLLFFSSPSKDAGTEVAVVDMLSAVVFTTQPGINNPPQPQTPSTPTFWIQVEDADGIYGPGAKHVGCTAISLSSEEELHRWLNVLNAACDPQTMVQQSEAEKAAAPVLSTTLLHNMKGAGLFNSLGSVLERKVIVHPASKTLTVYSNAAGSKAAAVLKLSAVGVQFHFRCDEKSPQKNFGHLKIEITAPVMGGKEDATQTHIFRARTYVEYTSWAASLASL